MDLKPADVMHMSAAITPDGRFALAGSHKDHVYLWDLRTGEVVRRFNTSRDFPNVQVSPDGRHFLATAPPAQLWDLDRETKLHEWTGSTGSAHFLADGRVVVFDGEKASLFAIAGGKAAPAGEYPVNTQDLAGFVVSRDGKRVAGIRHGKAQVLDLASGDVVWEWRRPWLPSFVCAVHLSPDGRYLFTGQTDGTVYVIHLPM